MTLAGARQPQDKTLIERGRQYLVSHLLDEGEGVTPRDKFYGGLGWGGLSDGGRADIISLEYGLRAMKETELPASSDAWNKGDRVPAAHSELRRAQRSGLGDQRRGFIYYPGFSTAGGTKPYGSATYAGIMSYTWANVKKSDGRVQDCLEMDSGSNYTVDENLGIGQKTVYYYMVFAKALRAVGENIIVAAKGQRHNWRETSDGSSYRCSTTRAIG
jgi:squalene-hopene/tetraprenyl-beta-curcumene cyclase